MIEYRSFHNTDPPGLAALWHACGLDRGAAAGFSVDALETLCFAQPYFDRHGLIVATSDGEVVGMVHAGFAADETRTRLDYSTGVICAVLVHPQFTRQGVGRRLVTLAETFLKSRGAIKITAGQAEPSDPFYVGLYGGSRPSGFLATDQAADLFFRAIGYEAVARHGILSRDFAGSSDPINVRLMSIRRKTELQVLDQPQEASWWWVTRFGRLDSVRFLLTAKGGGEPFAGVTVVGLDLYLQKWGVRAVGLIDLQVPAEYRRQGYGQALVTEVGRRLKQELVTRVEAHAPESDPIATALLETSGFKRIDTGIVYARPA